MLFDDGGGKATYLDEVTCIHYGTKVRTYATYDESKVYMHNCRNRRIDINIKISSL